MECEKRRVPGLWDGNRCRMALSALPILLAAAVLTTITGFSGWAGTVGSPGLQSGDQPFAPAAVMGRPAVIDSTEGEPPPLRSTMKLGPTLQFRGQYGAAGIGKGNTAAFGTAKGRTSPPASFTIYPVEQQEQIPWRLSDNEIPDPVPEAKGTSAGYPITITFPTGTIIRKVSGILLDGDGQAVDAWVSFPESPANAHYASHQRNTIALIAKQPLTADTTYTVEVYAEVNREAWSPQWSFRTAGRITVLDKDPKPAADVPTTLLNALNKHRRLACLGTVTLDEKLCKACELHARYLAQHYGKPEVTGLKAHDEDPDLAGYTVEGHKAGQSAVIMIHDPRPKDTVDGLIATLYHRIPMLDPDVTAIGVGVAEHGEGRWTVVIALAPSSEEK